MAVRHWIERVGDVLNAVAEIAEFTQGMERDQFLVDAKTIKAVELNFIIIGEAASQVPEDVQAQHPDVPWRIMKAMRNRLVHVYFDVDPQIVWETITNDLPTLLIPLRRLLEEFNAEGDDETPLEQPSHDTVQGVPDEPN